MGAETGVKEKDSDGSGAAGREERIHRWLGGKGGVQIEEVRVWSMSIVIHGLWWIAHSI